MNSIQAFLLEVIVERMDIREKTMAKSKTVGFSEGSSSKQQLLTPQNSSRNLISGSGLGERRRSGPPPPCSLTITFGDITPIIINEDVETVPEDLKESQGSEMIREIDEARELEDKEHAKAAGLSYVEYRSTKRKNPELLTSKKFSKGKSCLFRMRPTDLILQLRTEKLKLSLEGGWTYAANLGSAEVDFPAETAQAVVLAAYSTSMREMIAREGDIWWPKHLYRSEMLKEIRSAQTAMEQKKKIESLKNEKDAALRFRTLCKSPPMPKPCKLCTLDDDPCIYKPITYDDIALPKKVKKKRQRIDRKGAAWLLAPSPEPIKPPSLPTFAQTTEVVDIIDDTRTPTAIVSLFVRLSCFGNALELNRTADPFPFPDWNTAI